MMKRIAATVPLRQFLTAAAVVLCAAQVRAELPPDVYRDLQARAPEVLVIAVQDVRTQETRESWGRRLHVTVTAKVRQVQRSRTKLKPGQSIFIRYTHDRYNEPVAGPGQVPVLRKGQTCPAFLRYSGQAKGKAKRSYYGVAAGGYSFERMDPAGAHLRAKH
jgi:hypothetical protein